MAGGEMTGNVHELKCWPELFEPLSEGIKTFEVRKDDRGYEVGDALILKEWDPEKKEYTGDGVLARVNYILPGGQFGVEEGFVIMAVTVLTSFSGFHKYGE